MQSARAHCSRGPYHISHDLGNHIGPASVLEDKVDIGAIFSGLWRFLGIDLVVLALLVIFPIISLFLPMSMN